VARTVSTSCAPRSGPERPYKCGPQLTPLTSPFLAVIRAFAGPVAFARCLSYAKSCHRVPGIRCGGIRPLYGFKWHLRIRPFGFGDDNRSLPT